jgi:hypothetical protein
MTDKEKKVKKLLLIALVAPVLMACAESPSSDVTENVPRLPVAEPDAHILIAQGADALMPFKQQLMQALQQGMQEGPVSAIDVCRLQAPAIAEGVSAEGIEVGRSSHRVRNPDNAPNDWQQYWLDHYLETEDRAPQLMEINDGQVAYVEPIISAPLCGACHGAELAVDVQAALAEHYPQDQATGFAAGDLRGIFWVTMPRSF